MHARYSTIFAHQRIGPELLRRCVQTDGLLAEMPRTVHFPVTPMPPSVLIGTLNRAVHQFVLATLRRLLTYLFTYDALVFHACPDTLLIANTTVDFGSAREHQSP